MADRQLAILIYHRVLPERDPLFPEETTAQVFDRQLRVLKRWFHVLSLEQAAMHLANDSLPWRSVCLTFDDGYRDNYTTALPILRKHGLPATFFIASGYLGGARAMWNDIVIEAIRGTTTVRLDLDPVGLGSFALETPEQRRGAIQSIIRQIKYRAPAEREQIASGVAQRCAAGPRTPLMMSGEEVAALHRAGMTIGAHTVTHPILRRVTAAVALQEIESGRSFLEGVIDAPVRLFAYPNGRPGQDYDASHVELVRRAGFAAAVSTRPAMASRDSDPLQLPRLGVWDRAAPVFMARMGMRFMWSRANNDQKEVT